MSPDLIYFACGFVAGVLFSGILVILLGVMRPKVRYRDVPPPWNVREGE